MKATTATALALALSASTLATWALYTVNHTETPSQPSIVELKARIAMRQEKVGELHEARHRWIKEAAAEYAAKMVQKEKSMAASRRGTHRLMRFDHEMYVTVGKTTVAISGKWAGWLSGTWKIVGEQNDVYREESAFKLRKSGIDREMWLSFTAERVELREGWIRGELHASRGL